MTNLLYLDLSHNFFTSVPSGHIPSSVQYLDISCLEVKRLSESFGSLQKLKELKIAGCSEQKVSRLVAFEYRLYVQDLNCNISNDPAVMIA